MRRLPDLLRTFTKRNRNNIKNDSPNEFSEPKIASYDPLPRNSIEDRLNADFNGIQIDDFLQRAEGPVYVFLESLPAGYKSDKAIKMQGNSETGRKIVTYLLGNNIQKAIEIYQPQYKKGSLIEY